MPYSCTKFERNRSTRRVSLVGAKLLLQNGAKKKKNMKKMGHFQKHIYRELLG